MLCLQQGLARGNFRMTMKDAIFSHLESPGTKAYTLEEAREFLTRIGFSQVTARAKLSIGDLLTLKPSKKYDSTMYKIISHIYPRWLVRLMGDRYGLNLLINATRSL
jgi:hypothetical protein